MREQETEAAPNQKLPLFVKSIWQRVHRPIHAEQCDWEAFSRADGGSESDDRSAPSLARTWAVRSRSATRRPRDVELPHIPSSDFQPTTQPTKSICYMSFRVLWQSPQSC